MVDSTIMQKVKLKSQKLVKCGHVWVGLYRQAIIVAAKSATIKLDDVSSPSKPPQPLTDAANLKKRKLEQALLEQESKKSKSATTSLSTDTKQRWRHFEDAYGNRKREKWRERHKPQASNQPSRNLRSAFQVKKKKCLKGRLLRRV